MTIPLRWMILLLAASSLLTPGARGDVVSIGALSYDTFIAAGGGSPGVDAFDIANLTGAFSLPPDFPVTDSLTLQSAVLTLTLGDSTQQVFDLGDIGPGFLLDGSGNPVVQVSGDEVFASAELTATLSATTFLLFDGTSFTAGSASLDALLFPSSGNMLTVDVDQTTIDVSAPAAATSEPASLWLAAGAVVLGGLLGRGKGRHRGTV
jgi:hypothetical protein